MSWQRTPESRLSKWISWLIRGCLLLLLLLALPVVFFLIPATQCHRGEGPALARARDMPMADRQAVLAACVKYSRTLADPHDEHIYHHDPSPDQKGIPDEFKALQPMRVNIEADRASIKLHFCFDSGVFLYCENLDTPRPTAALTWGETGDKEPWVAP